MSVLSHRIVPDAVLGAVNRSHVERQIAELVERLAVPV